MGGGCAGGGEYGGGAAGGGVTGGGAIGGGTIGASGAGSSGAGTELTVGAGEVLGSGSGSGAAGGSGLAVIERGSVIPTSALLSDGGSRLRLEKLGTKLSSSMKPCRFWVRFCIPRDTLIRADST